MAVLVTGARGFVGSAVVRALDSQGTDVIAIADRWSSLDDLREMIGGRRVERTIHLGWYTGPGYLDSTTENTAGLNATTQLASLLVEDEPAPHIVVAGSWIESAQPRTAYGHFKSVTRNLLIDGFSEVGLATSWARIYNVTGAGEHPDRLLATVARAAIGATPLPMSEGEQIRDFIDVEDVAAALIGLSDQQAAGVFDVATGVGRTLRSMAELVGAAAGSTSVLDFGRLPYRPDEAMSAVGDPGPLHEQTAWRPRFSQEEVAERIAAYWRSQS